jgi:hypothetical protein
MSNSKQTPVIIRLSDDLGLKNRNDLYIYVVDNSGKVAETVPFKANIAELRSSKASVKAARVFVGPAFPKEYNKDKVNAIALANIGAYQISVDLAGGHTVTVNHLPNSVIQLPVFRLCEISGNVINTVDINGVPVTGPVCKARVHICQVQQIWLWPIWLRTTIPLPVLNELKEKFVALQWSQFHPPLPDPAVTANYPKTNLPLSTLVAKKKTSSTEASLQPLPADIHDQILSATPDTIHPLVQKYAEILYPYFCLWPLFWPWFYWLEEEICVETDCNGHFNAWLVSIGQQTENIYVWVEAFINGHWVTVYRPPFPCTTRWNYSCGTEINISLANPFIPPCTCDASVVDGTVWFTAIGWYGIALNIQQDETHQVVLDYLHNGLTASKTFKNVGCTNFGDANQLAPFGSTLDLYLAFGPTAPAGATHYRWSKTLILDSNQQTLPLSSPDIIPGLINRPYTWPLAAGGFGSGTYPLFDTDVNGNIGYKIPNYIPGGYPGVPGDAEWEQFNFVSASLDSTSIPNGYTVRFDLELLKADTTGVFQVVPVPPSVFQVSRNTDYSDVYGGSIPAPPDYLTPDLAHPGNVKSLSLKVRIDNAPVMASINDVWLLDNNGIVVPGSNSGPCGFIHYTDPSLKARLSFWATEPFSLATFDYKLVKGDSGDVIPAICNAYVFEDAGVFSQSGGLFSADILISTLLGHCIQGAYSQELKVYSLATNGSVQLSGSEHLPYYDDHLTGFALSDH